MLLLLFRHKPKTDRAYLYAMAISLSRLASSLRFVALPSGTTRHELIGQTARDAVNGPVELV
jgi:hypothetical protein